MIRSVRATALLTAWFLLGVCANATARVEPLLGQLTNHGPVFAAARPGRGDARSVELVSYPPSGPNLLCRRVDIPAPPVAPPRLDQPGQTKVLETYQGEFCPLEERLFADAADGRLDGFTLLQAALVASGVDNVDTLARYEARLAEVAAEMKRSGRLTGDARQQAQAILEFMHRRLLTGGYRIDCTDLRIVFDQGRFNCVSASVLFNCLAETVGMSVCGLEMPGHAMSRVRLGEGSLDVETTCARWFHLMNDPKKQAELVASTLGQKPSKKDRAKAREVSALEMAAMIYYNRGVDLLAEKRFAEAAAVNARAVRLDPANATARGNLLATLNNWSIELGSQGEYAQAVELLRQGLAFAADYEPFALNFVHVHHQWVQSSCAEGRFEEALKRLAEAARQCPDQPYFQHAEFDVYRAWARCLLEQKEWDLAFALFDQARSGNMDCPELDQAEQAAVNDHGLLLLERGEFEEAVRLFGRGVSRQPTAELLRENRRVAVMRWAEVAFEAGDYAEAIRRTTYGAQPGELHASLLNNVRYGYHQWSTRLDAAGRRAEAEQVTRQASADLYLRAGSGG